MLVGGGIILKVVYNVDHLVKNCGAFQETTFMMVTFPRD